MARAKGPLFSLAAQGTLGGAITYQRHAGARSFVRSRPVPRNPRSAPQSAPRNAIRAISQGILWTATTAQFAPGHSVTDVARIRAAVTETATWTAALLKALLGVGLAAYTTTLTAWSSLTSEEQDAWDAAAAATVPPVRPATQRGPGNSTSAALSAGNVFWIYRSGLTALGLAPAPTGTPPVYWSGGEPTMQALYRVETSEYDASVETEGPMDIAGLTITQTLSGGWVNILGTASIWNGADDYNQITCAIMIDDVSQVDTPGGQAIPNIYAGENRQAIISHFVQLSAGEHTISMTALASLSGGVIQSNFATLIVHDMGF